jgi:hypothetical protein
MYATFLPVFAKVSPEVSKKVHKRTTRVRTCTLRDVWSTEKKRVRSRVAFWVKLRS